MTPAQLATVLADRAVWTDDGHLLWVGAVTKKGYGVVTIGGRKIGVHRLIATLTYGPPPKGSQSFATHACDTPNCLAPLHVRWGDAMSNLAEARERGRWPGPWPQCVQGHPKTGDGAEVFTTNYGIVRCRVCRRLAERQRRVARTAVK